MERNGKEAAGTERIGREAVGMERNGKKAVGMIQSRFVKRFQLFSKCE